MEKMLFLFALFVLPYGEKGFESFYGKYFVEFALNIFGHEYLQFRLFSDSPRCHSIKMIDTCFKSTVSLFAKPGCCEKKYQVTG